jgi:amino acid transporter
MTATTSTPSQAEGAGLKRGALGLWDDVGIAVSSTAPAYSIGTTLAALALAVALGGPAAIWVGFLPVTGIAIAYYYLNRAMPNCGTSYTWTSKALHPSLGFLSGWVVILTDILFMSFAAPQCGQALLQLFNAWGLTDLGGISLDSGNSVAATIFGVVFLAIVTYMVVVGIQLAARLQWVLLSIEYLIVLGFSILGFFHGGGSSFSIDWFNPFALGLGGLAAGVVISVFFYWGWDTASTVNEETEGASENPGRAGIIGMFLLLLLFLVACTSIQMVLTPKELQDNASTTLTAFANKLVGPQWGSLAILAFLSSTIATLQTTLLPSARTAFSMGRDGMLGKIWARIDPRWNTPAIGTIIMGVISAAIALGSLALGSSLGAVVTAGVTSIGLLVAFYYGLVGISCAVYYRRAFSGNPMGMLLAGVIPVLSALVLFGLAGYLIYQDWTSSDTFAFDATNGKFNVLVPLAILLAGVPALAYVVLARHPDYMGLPSESASPDALGVEAASAA